jgi:hypothetical protein
VDAITAAIRAKCDTDGLNVTVSVPSGQDATASFGGNMMADLANIFADTESALTVMTSAVASPDATTSAFTASTVDTTSTNSGMTALPSFVAIALVVLAVFFK